MKIILPKAAVILAVLLAQAMLLSGCEPPPVWNDQIVSLNRAIVESMQDARAHSVEATVAVDKAFQDIAMSLRSGGVSDQWVEYLEEQRPILKLKSAKLRGDLNKMRTQSASLFTLLRRRTADNQTQRYRDEMAATIDYQEAVFQFNLNGALARNDEIDARIQAYDDRLGYIQVMYGLRAGVDRERAEFRQWAGEARQLDREVQDAISRAERVVRALERTERE